MSATTRPVPNHTARQVAHATNQLEVKLFNFLQWYTSFFYWGAGLFLGLTAGYWLGLYSYVSTVIYDAFHFFERRAPAAVKRGTQVAPAPGEIPAAARGAAAKAVATGQAAAAKVVGEQPLTRRPAAATTSAA